MQNLLKVNLVAWELIVPWLKQKIHKFEGSIYGILFSFYSFSDSIPYSLAWHFPLNFYATSFLSLYNLFFLLSGDPQLPVVLCSLLSLPQLLWPLCFPCSLFWWRRFSPGNGGLATHSSGQQPHVARFPEREKSLMEWGEELGWGGGG
jgi:hypothetical protein